MNKGGTVQHPQMTRIANLRFANLRFDTDVVSIHLCYPFYPCNLRFHPPARRSAISVALAGNFYPVLAQSG
jgi:hypothetical protein